MPAPPSAVWPYFDRFENANGKVSRCKECGFELRGHGASNAKRHLKLVHSIGKPETEDNEARLLRPSRPHLLAVQVDLLDEKKHQLLNQLGEDGGSTSQLVPGGATSLGPIPIDTSSQERGSLENEDPKERRKRQTRHAVRRYRHRIQVKEARTEIINAEVKELKGRVNGNFGSTGVPRAPRKRRAEFAFGREAWALRPLQPQSPTACLVPYIRVFDFDRRRSADKFMETYKKLIAVGYWKDEIEPNDMIRIQGFDNSPAAQWGHDYSSVCLVDHAPSGEETYIMNKKPGFMGRVFMEIPVWTLLEELAVHIFDGPQGTVCDKQLVGFYDMVLQVLDVIMVTTVGKVEQRVVDEHITYGHDGWSEFAKYFYTEFKLSGVTSQEAQKMIEPHLGCRESVVLDVLNRWQGSSIGARISFTYYVKLAGRYPALKGALKKNLTTLRRELVQNMLITREAIDVKRDWAFSDETGETFQRYRGYKVVLKLDEIRRYEARQAFLQLGDDLQFYDFDRVAFTSHIKFLRTQFVILRGFSSTFSVAVEQINRAVKCLLDAEHVQMLTFHFDQLCQLAAFLNAKRRYPGCMNHLTLDMAAASGPLHGELLANCFEPQYSPQIEWVTDLHIKCARGIRNASMAIVALIKRFANDDRPLTYIFAGAEIFDIDKRIREMCKIMRPPKFHWIIEITQAFRPRPSLSVAVTLHFRVDKDDRWRGSYNCYRSDGIYFHIAANIDDYWIKFETWAYSHSVTESIADAARDEPMAQYEPGPSTSAGLKRAKRPAKRKFAGEGHRLGSAVPGSPDTTQLSEEDQAELLKAAQDLINLNEDAPTKCLQIAVPTGQRLIARFNHYHSIADVRRFIVAAVPSMGFQPFKLMTTFPTTVISKEQEEQTLDDAGLLNSVLVVKPDGSSVHMEMK